MVVFVLLRSSDKLSIEQKKDFCRQFESKTVKQLNDVEEKQWPGQPVGRETKHSKGWGDLTFKIKAWGLSMAERQECRFMKIKVAVVSLIIPIKLIN